MGTPIPVTSREVLKPESAAAILLVSPHDADLKELERVLENSTWKICQLRTLEEAVTYLNQKHVPVVVCECELPDDGWKRLLAHIARQANPPNLILTSRVADDCLWCEALNLGAYNVLAKPYDCVEAVREISLAWFHWIARRKEVGQRQSVATRSSGA